LHTQKIVYCLFIVFIFSFSLLIPADLAFAAPKKGKKGKGDAEGDAAAAQTIAVCAQDIYYSWRRIPPRTRTNPNNPVKTSPAQEEMFKPIEVFYARITEEGADENAAKSKLSSSLANQQDLAAKYCEQEHNNKTRCVVSKLKSLEKDYRNLDYRIRKTLLDSVTDDCARNAGLCVSTRGANVSCLTKKVKTSGEDAAEEGKGKKKGKKKK